MPFTVEELLERDSALCRLSEVEVERDALQAEVRGLENERSDLQRELGRLQGITGQCGSCRQKMLRGEGQG